MSGVSDVEELDSGTRSGAYRLVEGLHLRQWLVRSAAPIAVLASNGRGLYEVAWLPRHDVLDVSPQSEWAMLLVGATLVVLACVLRVLAKGVLVRKTSLTTGGVYGFVRHPFYTASIAGGVGTLCVAGELGTPLAVVWLAAAIPVFDVTIRGEEEGLSTIYGARWKAYADRVRGRVLPAGPRRPDAGEGDQARVSWANLRAEREPPRFLRFIAGVLVVVGVGLTSTTAYALLIAAAVAFAASHLPPLQAPSRRAAP